jgi:hypothetical protein
MPPPPAPPADDIRPGLFRSVPGLADVNTDPETVAGNSLLAILILLAVLYSTTLINATIKEHSEELSSHLMQWLAPFSGLFALANGFFARPPGNQSFFAGLVKPLILLAIVSIIYGFLDPDFGLNRESLVLVGSLALAMMVITYVFEGGQVLASERVNGQAADLYFYPFPIILALVSVMISRIIGINPGLLVGFIGSARFLSPDIHKEGRAIFYSMVAMAVVSVVAWLLISPVRSLEAGNNVWWAAALEAGVIAIFVGGIEGILFSLIPLEFIDGKKLWLFNRFAWFAVALPAAFFFFHVVLHFENTLGDSAKLAIAALALSFAASLVWYVFRTRTDPAAGEAQI